MPQPALPPTPASSTDIKGRDGTSDITGLQMAFELPPPALATSSASTSSSSPSRGARFAPPKGDYPVQPSETVKSRRRSSAANKESKVPFELPPPPTRSRKIIQMKPKKQEDKVEAAPKAGPATKGTGSTGKTSGATAGASSSSTASTASDLSATSNSGSTAVAPSASASKKKQPSATSAAGRKIARKTAHSLIERRRRSKMNEEFAVLKGMIPACTGEMHKLAILQASIEYVRYLEDCISKLQAEREEREEREDHESPVSLPEDRHTPDFRHLQHQQHHQPLEEAHGAMQIAEPEPEPEPVDVEMTGSTVPSPTYSNAPSSHRASISPAIQARDPLDRRESYSSSISADRRFSYTTSATTSPAFGPQTAFGYGAPGTLPSLSSALTSPALGPQGDADHEATAALMMLNADRRGYFAQRQLAASQGESTSKGQAGAGRGMSVRDLLST